MTTEGQLQADTIRDVLLDYRAAQQQLILMQTAFEKIKIVCQRHHNPSVVTSTHILANKVLAIIKQLEQGDEHEIRDH